jgi:hypothetical protein
VGVGVGAGVGCGAGFRPTSSWWTLPSTLRWGSRRSRLCGSHQLALPASSIRPGTSTSDDECVEEDGAREAKPEEFEHALALVVRQRESLIGAVTSVTLPLTFLSTAFMQQTLVPN